MRLSLTPHSDTPSKAVQSLDVDVVRLSGERLQLRYILAAALDDLAIPPVGDGGRTDELWRHTCFEAFVRPEPGPAYLELNFAPSSAWAAYRFDAARQGMAPAEVAETRFMRSAMFGTLEYRAVVGLGPALAPGVSWRLGLSAVIEETSGRISYWALAHPPGKPDFHHADGFALELPPVGF